MDGRRNVKDVFARSSVFVALTQVVCYPGHPPPQPHPPTAPYAGRPLLGGAGRLVRLGGGFDGPESSFLAATQLGFILPKMKHSMEKELLRERLHRLIDELDDEAALGNLLMALHGLQRGANVEQQPADLREAKKDRRRKLVAVLRENSVAMPSNWKLTREKANART